MAAPEIRECFATSYIRWSAPAGSRLLGVLDTSLQIEKMSSTGIVLAGQAHRSASQSAIAALQHGQNSGCGYFCFVGLLRDAFPPPHGTGPRRLLL